MNPTEIGASYDQIAERWDGDEFDRTNGISLHERALTFLEHGAMALDVGCGCSGRGSDSSNLFKDYRSFFVFIFKICGAGIADDA